MKEGSLIDDVTIDVPNETRRERPNAQFAKMAKVLTHRITSIVEPYGFDKRFKLRIHVKHLNESYTVSEVTSSTMVRQLKVILEELTGIPGPLQQLYFLDRCSLTDNETLDYFDVLPNSKLSLRLFKPWEEIITACCRANVEKLEELLPLNKETLSDWEQFYIYVAAFVAAHRGHSNVLERLVQTKVDLNRELPSGRHPLLVSVRRRQLKCTEIILGRRVRAQEWNISCESLHNWKIQDKIKANYEKIKQLIQDSSDERTTRMTASQMYDSKLSTWLQGSLARRYLCVILDGKGPRKKSVKVDRPVFRP